MRSKKLLLVIILLLGLGFVGLLAGLAAHQAQAMAPLPTWQQVNSDGFGDPEDQQIPSLEVFGDYIYAGVHHWDGVTASAQVWRASDGEDWVMVDNRPVNGTADLEVFDGNIYAGSWDGNIWSSPNGITWTQVITNGFEDTAIGIARFAAYSGKLYASTWEDGTKIWRTANGTDWELFVDDGMGNINNIGAIASEVFNGELYWGVMNLNQGGEIWRTNGISTTVVMTGGFGIPQNQVVSSLAVYGNQIYAGLMNLNGVQVWRSLDGEQWDQVLNGLGNPVGSDINALEVFQDKLYLVLEDDYTGMQVWRTSNGKDWEQVGFAGFGDVNNQWSFWDNAVTVFKDNLYVGANNFVTGGEVWQMTPEVNPPASVSITGPTEGVPGQAYAFTAAVEPITTTLPLTYTWEATGQMPVTHTGGLTDTVSFTWETPGDQVVTVTAANQAGSVSVSHSIAINQQEFKQFLPLVMRYCTPFIFDDFSNPNSGMPVGDYPEVTYAYLDGEYQILVKPPMTRHGVITDVASSNYRVDVDARPASNLDGAVVLIFGWTDTDRYYSYEISDGLYSLWRFDGDISTPLIDWTASDLIYPGYATNHLTVVRSGGEITLYVNHQYLASLTDTTYTGTFVGIMSESFATPNFDGRFDNLAVYTVCGQ